MIGVSALRVSATLPWLRLAAWMAAAVALVPLISVVVLAIARPRI